LRSDDGTDYEIIFYITGGEGHKRFTPIVIKDKILIGWGWTFVDDNVKEYIIDIR
jgi:hypothetical protein